MTATDTIRAMLDERGVEWRRTPHYSSESIDNETVFRGEGIEWIANDHFNGHIGLRALRYEVTPEQAIEATLSRGECRKLPSSGDTVCIVRRYGYEMEFGYWRCSECGCECFEGARYCMNCGRKVRA